MMWRLAAIACAILLALVVPSAWRHLREVPPPPPPAVRGSLTAPAGAELGSGDEVLDAAISPDGRQIVFVATANGIAQLWRRALDTDRAEPIPGTEGAAMPAWKTTGRVVSFFATGRLKQVALDAKPGDGGARDLAEAPAPAGAGWLPDGSLLFVPDGRGPVRHLRDGVATDATKLAPGDRGHGFPVPVESGGFTYVATLENGRRMVRLSEDGAEHDLTETAGHAEMIRDSLVHVRDGTLMAQRYDRVAAELNNRSTPLAFNVGVAASGHAFFAASPRLVMWAAAAPRARQLAWYGLDGRPLGNVGEPADYWQVSLSPNDRDAAVTLLDPLLRTLDLMILPLTSSPTPEQFALAIAADSDPVWAPEGDRVAYRSMLDGQANLFVRRAHAPDSPPEPLLRSELDETPSDWRGGTLLFHAPGNAGLDIWALDLARVSLTRATRQGFNKSDAHWSPDGQEVAYVSDEPGRPDIYVEPYPPDGTRVRASFGGGTRPRWGRDGTSLYFLRNGRLMRAEELDEAFSVATQVLDVPDLRDYSLAHGSDRVLVIAPRERAGTPAAGIIVDWMPQ